MEAEKCTFFGPFVHGISARVEMAKKCTFLASLPHCFSPHAEMAEKCTFLGPLLHMRRSSEGHSKTPYIPIQNMGN